MRTACPWPWRLSNSRLAQGGAVFGGGKGGSGGTTYQTQQTQIPPEVKARYDAINARAEQVAQTPFQPYQGQFVAPINQTQQAGINQIASAGAGYQPYQRAATSSLTGAAEAALPFYSGAANALQTGTQAAQPYYQMAGNNIAGAQVAAQPYLGLAGAAALRGAGPVNAQGLQIGQYMDPYVQSVITPTMQGLRQQQQAEQSQLMGSQAMRGAFGGDRGNIASSTLARQQDLASAQVEAGLRSQGYGQALGAAQQQQGVTLGAEQANRAAMANLAPQALQIGQQAFQQPMAAAQAQQGLGQGIFGLGQASAQGQMGIGQGVFGLGQGVAQGLSGLGQQGLQSGLAAGQATLGAGTLEQQTQQQLNSALYNQYLQQQGYPFQVAQFLANIALGTGPLYGSTQTGVTGQPTPFFSDERLKEDIVEIGRTHDGQRIIKFRYKGEPEGTTHIGLSAQDVEHHHPEAVSETPEGIKAVDYDMATKHAERGGLAGGGVPVPGMNPNAEEAAKGLAPWSVMGPKNPGMQRLALAVGGTPGVDAYSQELLQQIANPMGKTLPHGSYGSMPGKPGAWSPKLAVQSSGLKPPSLPTPPAQGKTGLGQAIDTAKGAVDVYEAGEKIYKGGEKAVDWLKRQLPYDGGTASGTSAYGSPAPDLPADNPMGPRAYGGRAGLAAGGMPTDLPYADAEGEHVPEKLTETEPTPQLNEPKMQPQPGLGGGQQKDQTAGKAMKLAAMGASFIPGVGPFLSAGLSAGSMFVARGGAVDIDRAKHMISRVESGGNYGALGPMVGGDRAHGKYQVMGANIPSWTEEALGRRMTPEEFLKSPEAQERVFEHHFGKYLAKHGSLEDAASMWHSGRPLAEARARGLRDVNMSTEDYVRKVLGGAPPAEAHMREEAPRMAGLAPKITDVEDLNADVDTSEFRDLELPKQFAAGGLAGRHGYQTAGAVQTIDPDQVDPNNPDQTAILTAQQQRGAGLGRPAPAPAAAPPAPASVVRTDERTRDDRDLAGYNPPGLAPPPKVPGVADDRDLFNRMGDWYERNQNWVLPAVSGIGKMLASRSPYLLNAVGEGLAEAAPTAMAANFKQQGLDISMMDRLGKQIGVLASDIALRGGPGMSPDLDRAQAAAMKKYYELSGVKYTPTVADPAAARAAMATSPFSRLRQLDNPDMLYHMAQTPGLPPEQKQNFMEQAVKATRRLMEQGFGIADDGTKVEFGNIYEAFRNSQYGLALVQAAGQTAGSGAPGGSQYLANIDANLSVAQADYNRALGRANNDTQHPDVLAAERRVRELQAAKERALSPTVGRAFGGRTGYATDGAVDEVPMEEDNVQLAQATPSPTVPTMPTLPKPPSQAPAATPQPPVTQPSQGMPGGNPQTAADYWKLHQTTQGLVPKEVTDMYQRKALELEQMAVTQGKQPGPAGVGVAPGSVETGNKLANAAHNTKWVQEQTERQQNLNPVQTGLDVLTEALSHVNTNPLAPFTAKVTEYARGLGFNVGSESERAAAVQEIAKQVAQQAQSAGTDLGRIMTTEGAAEAIKNPRANRAIVAQAYAKLDHERERFKYYQDKLKNDYSQNPGEIQAAFERDHPIERYYERRFNELAFPGSTPLTESGALDWNELKPGARYVLSPREWERVSGGQRIDQPKKFRVHVRTDGRKEMVPE